DAQTLETLRGFFDSVKFVENLLLMFFRHPDTEVADGKIDAVITKFCHDLYLVAAGSVFDRVCYKIDDDLLNPHFVAKNLSTHKTGFMHFQLLMTLLYHFLIMIKYFIKRSITSVELHLASFYF